MLYNLYMLDKAGITQFSLSVGGDDTFILVEACDLEKFNKVFKTCYSPVTSGTFGLGQCARFMQVLPDYTIDFLSRIGIHTGG